MEWIVEFLAKYWLTLVLGGVVAWLGKKLNHYKQLTDKEKEQQRKQELDEIVAETKAEEEELREQARNLELNIEPRLLTSFKRIRKSSRNGLGIVYVERDACAGCFSKIPPQRQMDIRMRKKIIVCENCGRIMIDPELAGVQQEKSAETAAPKRRGIRRAKAE